MDGISATGRAMGWQGSPRQNYVLDWSATGTATAYELQRLGWPTAGQAFGR